MKVWKLAVSLLCWTAVFSLGGIVAQAAGFAPAITAEEGEPGSVVEVTLPYDGTLGEVAAFRTDVEYDADTLEYLRPQYGEALQEGFVTIEEKSGLVSAVYTAPGDGPFLIKGESVTFRFRVREEAPSGTSSIFVSVFEISGPEPSLLNADTDVSFSFRVPEPPSDDARLLTLIPDYGTLEPAFAPDRFTYSMTVPYEVEAVTFTAEPVAGALCRVNRKNLGAGGSDTVFTITVTAEDGETKNVYQIVVHREEKEESILSDDARLLSLKPATGTLTPDFAPDQFSYTLTVPYEVTTMSFTAEASEGAVYRVNRKNLGAGGSDTLFTITVTAEDGETKTVYQVTVHRQEKQEEAESALSNDARLLSLAPAAGTLTPDFDPDQLSYTLAVPYEVTTMSFTAQVPEGAVYRVNRKNLGAGGSDTLFTITVTAEDGKTKTVYQVTVHRGEKESSASSGSTPKPTTGGGSSQKQDVSQSSGLEGENSDSSSGEEVLPIAGLTDTGSGPNSGPGANGGEGTDIAEGNPGGVVFQNGDASLVPGMLAMLLFVLFCFLSGPLAKGLAKRFPGKQSTDVSPEEKHGQ